jgi:hypothetical protein
MNCIDREAALKAIEGKEYKFQVYEAIQNLPAIEPERPKGKWVDGICNKCGYDGGVEAISGKANYCSICGADMRGASE